MFSHDSIRARTSGWKKIYHKPWKWSHSKLLQSSVMQYLHSQLGPSLCSKSKCRLFLNVNKHFVTSFIHKCIPLCHITNRHELTEMKSHTLQILLESSQFIKHAIVPKLFWIRHKHLYAAHSTHAKTKYLTRNVLEGSKCHRLNESWMSTKILKHPGKTCKCVA